MARPAVAVVLIVVSVLVGCSSGPAPEPPSDAERVRAAAEFEEAYTDFRIDLDAGNALGEEDGLQNDVRSVRAVRAAYFDLDTTTRDIEMPTDLAGDVNAMLGAIGELIAALDRQGAATTSDDFRAADPASRAGLQEADEAIEVVVDALGVAADADPSGAANGDTNQRPLEPGYITDGTVDDAGAWVADLLTVGADNVNHRIPAEDMGVVVAWRAAFPEVLSGSKLVGYERQAPRNGVSGYSVLPTNVKSEASRANPYYLAFAARDDSGACAGGVLSGYPDPTEGREVTLKPGTRCSGAEVAVAAGY